MRPDLLPGTTFPDYQPADQDGNPRRLSELQNREPMVLVLLARLKEEQP